MSFTIEQVSEAFRLTLVENKADREKAEAFFNEASEHKEFAIMLMKILNGDFGVVNDQIAKSSSVYLKNMLQKRFNFSAEADIREMLCNVAFNASPLARPQLLRAITLSMRIAHDTYLQAAVQTMREAMAANNMLRLKNALYIACKIANYKQPNGSTKWAAIFPIMDSFYVTAMDIVKVLLANGPVAALQDESSSEILYLILRVLYHNLKHRFVTSAVNTHERVSQVIELAIQVASAALPFVNPENLKTNKSFWARSKKWSLRLLSHCANRCTDRGIYEREKEILDQKRRIERNNNEIKKNGTKTDKLAALQEDQAAYAKHYQWLDGERTIFNTTIRPLTVKITEALLPLAVDPSKPQAERQHMWMSQTQFAVTFFILSLSVSNKDLHPILLPYIEPLTLQVALNYLDWTSEQERLANDDPESFIECDLVKFDAEAVPSDACRVFIIDTAKNIRSMFAPLLRTIQERVAAALSPSVTPAQLAKSAGALLALNDIRSAFLSAAYKSVPLEDFLIQAVTPLLTHPSPVVAYRAAAALSGFRTILDQRLTPVSVVLSIIEKLTEVTITPKKSVLVASAAVTVLAEFVAVDMDGRSAEDEEDEEEESSKGANKKSKSEKKKIAKHKATIDEAALAALKPFASRIVQRLLELLQEANAENLFRSMTAFANAFPDEVASSAAQILNLLINALDRIDGEGDDIDDSRAWGLTEELFTAAKNIVQAVLARRESSLSTLSEDIQRSIRRLANFRLESMDDESAVDLLPMLVCVGDDMECISMNKEMTKVPSLTATQWGVLFDIYSDVSQTKKYFEISPSHFEALKQICFNSVRECLTKPVEGFVDNEHSGLGPDGRGLVGYKAIMQTALAMMNHDDCTQKCMGFMLIGYLFESLRMAGNGACHAVAKQILGDKFPGHVLVLILSWFVQESAKDAKRSDAIRAAGLDPEVRYDYNSPQFEAWRLATANHPQGYQAHPAVLDCIGYAYSAVVAFNPIASLGHLASLGEETANNHLQLFARSLEPCVSIRTPRMAIFALTNIVMSQLEFAVSGQTFAMPSCWQAGLPMLLGLFPKLSTKLLKYRQISIEDGDEEDDDYFFGDDDGDSEGGDWDKEYDAADLADEDTIAREAADLLDDENAWNEEEEDEDEEIYLSNAQMMGVEEDRQDLMDTVNVIDFLANKVLANANNQGALQGIVAQIISSIGGADILKGSLEAESKLRNDENELIAKQDAEYETSLRK